jgi:hypothetical protein
MSGVFGYILNTIAMILEDINRKEKLLKLERERLNRFMKKRKINLKLRERVTSYLEYLQE